MTRTSAPDHLEPADPIIKRCSAPLAVVVSYSVFPEQLILSVAESNLPVRWHIHYHGSSEAFAKRLSVFSDSLPNSILFDHRVNHGLARSWNASLSTLDIESNELAFIFNDDLYFKSGGFAEFSNFIAMDRAKNPKDPQYYTVLANEIGEGALADICPQGMACCAINAKMIQTVGLFDETFVPAYFEDCDYFRRMRLLGYEFRLDMRALCVHERSLSSRSDEELKHQLPTIIAKNRKYYLEKWGGDPDHEIYETPFNL